MNVRQNTTRCDGDTTKKLVELLVIANGELNMARNDSRLLVVTSSVASELQHLGGEVFHHSSHIDWGASPNAIGITTLSEETMDTADRKLKACLTGTGLRGFLGSHFCESQRE